MKRTLEHGTTLTAAAIPNAPERFGVRLDGANHQGQMLTVTGHLNADDAALLRDELSSWLDATHGIVRHPIRVEIWDAPGEPCVTCGSTDAPKLVVCRLSLVKMQGTGVSCAHHLREFLEVIQDAPSDTDITFHPASVPRPAARPERTEG